MKKQKKKLYLKNLILAGKNNYRLSLVLDVKMKEINYQDSAVEVSS